MQRDCNQETGVPTACQLKVGITMESEVIPGMAANGTTITRKGQVTIPKRIRDALKLNPGCRVVFEVGEDGKIFLRKSGARENRRADRFDRAVGASRIKWDGTTDAYMELIRGYSEDPAVDPLHTGRP